MKITGVGPVTPAGIGREAFWRGIQEPLSRVKPFTCLDSEWGPFIAATVDDDELNRAVNKRSLPNHLARHTWFGAAAGRLAVQDAGIDPKDIQGMGPVIVTGTSIMDFGGITRELDSVARNGIKGIIPRLIYTVSVANVAAAIAESLGLEARTLAIQSSCCSGLDAIGRAAEMIANGESDFVIAGGSEAPLFKHPLLEFRRVDLTPSTWERAEEHCRPFDLWRTTGTVSEGASMFVLEPDSSPRPGYCWVDGHAFSNDQPDRLCGGLAVTMRDALANAGLLPERVDVINAWAPGHPRIDAAESSMITEVFGSHTKNILVHSVKGALGNALGGAPGLQVATSALGLRHQVVAPTVNWQYRDPACPLEISAQCQHVAHRVALINAHGISGMNSTLVVSQWK